MKTIRLFSSLSLLVLAALFLSACGAVPANNFAGLSTDGTNLYVANHNFVFSVNASSGAVNWKFPEKPDQAVTFFGAPALTDGWVYAGNYNNVAYGFALESINPGSPTPTWTYNEFEGKGRFIGAPAVAGDVVLFPSSDHHLYVLDREDGTLRWRLKTRNALWAPAASDGEVAYQPGLDHYLYAFNLASGKSLWEVDLGGPIVAGIVLGPDGQIFIGTLNREFLAVDSASGNILWRKSVEGNVWSGALLHEGKLYFGTDKNKVYILDASTGAVLKSLDSATSVIASPVYTDGAVAFCNEGGEVFTVGLDGESRPWTRTIKGKLYSSPLVINDQIVLAPYQGDQALAGYDFAGNLDAKWNTVELK